MTDEDEEYLDQLLLLHPEIDHPEIELGPVGAPSPSEPASTEAALAEAAPAQPALAGVAGRSGPSIAYDGDGWISVVPDEPAPTPEPSMPVAALPLAASAAPPPLPPLDGDATRSRPWWRRNASYLAIALIIAVVVAGMALAPEGDRPVLLSGVPTTEKSPTTDPLSEDWRLDKVNLQFTEVEEGYVQVFDGAVDPVGTDGCTQPTRDDGVIASSKAAYAYRPAMLNGFVAGHVASMVTVFRDEAAAQRRVEVERASKYLTCLSDWDQATWFGGTSITPSAQAITPIPAALKGRSVLGARYTASYQAPDGKTYPAYTDHIIVTTGRVRVWIELSLVLYPYDAKQRDVIVDHILDRVDEAIAAA